MVYHALAEFEKALEHSMKSLKISSEMGNRQAEGTSYSHIAGVYHALGQ